jgi:inosine/xanthosine triphosphate pyrophosphatase family protein
VLVVAGACLAAGAVAGKGLTRQPGQSGEGRKQFFFEKKNQKTFDSWAEPRRKGRGQIFKSFFTRFT